MAQNFNPEQLAADVANLTKQVADLSDIITGRTGFSLASIKEVLEACEAAARVVGDFVPEVARIDLLIQPVLPLASIVPAILADYAGESAGTGATLESGVVIPSSELGVHTNEPIVPPAVNGKEEQPPGNA